SSLFFSLESCPFPPSHFRVRQLFCLLLLLRLLQLTRSPLTTQRDFLAFCPFLLHLLPRTDSVPRCIHHRPSVPSGFLCPSLLLDTCRILSCFFYTPLSRPLLPILIRRL